MKELINLVLIAFSLFSFVSCDDNNYPKKTDESIVGSLPAIYIDDLPKESFNLLITKVIIINSEEELTTMFNQFVLNPPAEVKTIDFDRYSFIMMGNFSEFRDIEVKHKLTKIINQENACPRYIFKITELQKEENRLERPYGLFYYTGIIIHKIVSGSDITYEVNKSLMK